MMHQALDDSIDIIDTWLHVYNMMIVTKRESMASLKPLYKPLLCRNVGLVSCIRDAILSRLVTIIKRLVHHAVYCISLSSLLSFLCNPYIYPLSNLSFTCHIKYSKNLDQPVHSSRAGWYSEVKRKITHCTLPWHDYHNT